MSKYNLQAIREKVAGKEQRYRELREQGLILVGRSEIEMAHQDLSVCGLTAEQRQITADLLAALEQHFVAWHLNMIANREVQQCKRVQVKLYDFTGHSHDPVYACGYTVAIEIDGADEYWGVKLPATLIHVTDGDKYVRIRRESRHHREFKVRIGHPRFEPRVAKAIRKLTTDRTDDGWIYHYPEFPLKWRGEGT